MGENSKFSSCSVECVLADGKVCKVSDAVDLHVKILAFSWTQQFKVLSGGPFPAILGLDFLERSGMSLDLASGTFCFRFAPESKGNFGIDNTEGEEAELVGHWLTVVSSAEADFSSLFGELPQVFSEELGAAKCVPYEIELSDHIPVRSPPYRCAPPKLSIFREMIDDLLKKGVVRPSKSLYASPAFLVPKRDGSFRMVVDYRRVNAKIIFDSYPMPTIEQAFEHFGGAAVFSVLDLNLACYQIPLSVRSRRVTAFCTPFGLFEFNKLPMGVSVGYQELSRVIDELFAHLKGQYVFNFLDGLVVYSKSTDEHMKHLREVLGRFQAAGFTLNREKVSHAQPASHTQTGKPRTASQSQPRTASHAQPATHSQPASKPRTASQLRSARKPATHSQPATHIQRRTASLPRTASDAQPAKHSQPATHRQTCTATHSPHPSTHSQQRTVS
jgi:hypothetical protein